MTNASSLVFAISNWLSGLRLINILGHTSRKCGKRSELCVLLRIPQSMLSSHSTRYYFWQFACCSYCRYSHSAWTNGRCDKWLQDFGRDNNLEHHFLKRTPFPLVNQVHQQLQVSCCGTWAHGQLFTHNKGFPPYSCSRTCSEYYRDRCFTFLGHVWRRSSCSFWVNNENSILTLSQSASTLLLDAASRFAAAAQHLSGLLYEKQHDALLHLEIFH
jgi:hypothetical protein